MSTKYFALLTNIGAAKLAKATALGMQIEITQMAVGDGNDTLPTPDPAQTALAREIRRAPLNVLTVDLLNTSQIIAEQVIPEDVGGWWIREIGLFDKDGDMVAIANCAETYKPKLQEGSGRVQVIRMILIVSSTQAVTLKIDPAVVLATRQYVDSEIIEVKSYVDDKLTEHAQSRNHPDATLTDKGFVQLSNATGSADETKAATPKAVKAAMDNANKRQPGNENLTALSSLAGQPDKLPYFTNKGAMSLSDFAAFMRTMLSKTDAASVLE
ncbi:phage tail protein, partial [Salmonella enterica subsp. enterica serovar Braenderup]